MSLECACQKQEVCAKIGKIVTEGPFPRFSLKSRWVGHILEDATEFWGTSRNFVAPIFCCFRGSRVITQYSELRWGARTVRKSGNFGGFRGISGNFGEFRGISGNFGESQFWGFLGILVRFWLKIFLLAWKLQKWAEIQYPVDLTCTWSAVEGGGAQGAPRKICGLLNLVKPWFFCTFGETDSQIEQNPFAGVNVLCWEFFFHIQIATEAPFDSELS